MHVVRLSLGPEAEKRYSAMDSWESEPCDTLTTILRPLPKWPKIRWDAANLMMALGIHPCQEVKDEPLLVGVTHHLSRIEHRPTPPGSHDGR
jgi:hypothetical protein